MARGVQSGSKGASIIRKPPGSEKGGLEHVSNYFGIQDYAGREVHVAAFGEQIVGFKDPEVLAVFNFFVNPNQVKDLSTGSGALSTDSARLKLNAGVGAAVGEAIAQSKRNIIYRPGFDAYTLCTTAFDTPKTGTTQEFGPHDDINGYAIGLETDGRLFCARYRGGSLVQKEYQDEFALDQLNPSLYSAGKCPSGFTINPQAMNIYRIVYGYLGVLPPSFEVYAGANIGWVPFHYFDTIGQDNRLIIEDPFLPLRYHVTSDGTNEVTMYSGSWQAGIISSSGINNHLNDPFLVRRSFTTPATPADYPIFTLRNNTSFLGKSNKIAVDLHVLTAAVEGNKIHDLLLVRNGTLGGPTNFIPHDAANSIVDVDIASTSITGYADERAYPLGSISDLGTGVDFHTGEVRVLPGETVSLLVSSASNGSDVRAAIHWEELK